MLNSKKQTGCYNWNFWEWKISLVTIYAEAQRRYLETFSVYARQFIGELKRPDVEKIEGLSPVIAIEQKLQQKTLDQQLVLLLKYMTIQITLCKNWYCSQ